MLNVGVWSFRIDSPRNRATFHALKVRKFIMAMVDFGGKKEEVVTRKEFPMARARKVLKREVIAIIGYGVQGPAQALNLRDNGFKVIVGQRMKSKGWDRARKDGWVPGKTLFDIPEAVRRGTIV